MKAWEKNVRTVVPYVPGEQPNQIGMIKLNTNENPVSYTHLDVYKRQLLLDPEEQEAVYIMRKALNGMKSDEAVENILNMFVHTKNNKELVQMVKKQKFI